MIDKKHIQEQIKNIEREAGIHILYACESGSRAWGFPSPDSDFDVRFIYAHPKNWYLSLHEERDVIERNLEGDLDVGGWELRKVLRLMFKSNAIPWEWLQSPIIYQEQEGFREALLESTRHCYSLKSAFFHYHSLAERVLVETQANVDQIKSKKYFYILRPLLAAAWICDKKTIPPMEFRSLRETSRLSQNLQNEIDHLLEVKRLSNEKLEIPRSRLIDQFIGDTMKDCSQLAASLPTADKSACQLDEFFRNHIEGAE